MLLLHLVATLFMTGLIWFVQVVHYPLFGRVGQQGFPAYEAEHAKRTGWVVGPIMCLEALTAVLLAVAPPDGVGRHVPVAGLLLLAVIWLSTFFLQVPQHRILARGYDAHAHRKLVLTNWIRTAAWTMRSVLVLCMVA
jgi:hypothetical protein